MTRAVDGRGNTWLLLPVVSLLSTVPLPATISAFLAILGGSKRRTWTRWSERSSNEGKWYVECGQVIEIVMGGSLETKPCTSDKHSTHFRPTLTVVTEVHFFVDIGRRQVEIMP